MITKLSEKITKGNGISIKGVDYQRRLNNKICILDNRLCHSYTISYLSFIFDKKALQ